MKAAVSIALAALLFCHAALADPEDDRKAFVDYFENRFPDIPFAEYANGIYAIDKDAREQWQEIEEFPPYEFAIEQGQSLWQEPFADGKTYSDCFRNSDSGVRHLYPRFEAEFGEIITLDMAVNLCRRSHGEPDFDYGGEHMLAISAYMAFVSRGNSINMKEPGNDPLSLAAYEEGKRFYYTKRGQLNLSCSDCHVTSVGQYVRADHLSASLGHTTHFPVYRSKLGSMLSLHQRFSGCVRDVRAKPFELQSRESRNLEYFLTYMSNGLEVNGPGARK